MVPRGVLDSNDGPFLKELKNSSQASQFQIVNGMLNKFNLSPKKRDGARRHVVKLFVFVKDLIDCPLFFCVFFHYCNINSLRESKTKK